MAWRPSPEWWRGDPSVRGGVVMHPGRRGRLVASGCLPLEGARSEGRRRWSFFGAREGGGGRLRRPWRASWSVQGARFREHTSRRPVAVVALKQRSSWNGGEGCFPPCAAATVFRPGD
ncbi:Os03g0847300 [Oryza sativa Japonica Group]|uniref:Os03g0847300 protein n=2 Tax=Oryza sativa subsp. japonica TaxID=39947 RepID=Q84SP6_ORYSJ|nr:hypothetical protein [Oryza sativa Japonica Group]KAF2942324.1 hypothetical protein DAI22_03g413100 [Oryza sativa Japonica Group]BAS87348.1 Os03g0847300 [Oryza sativa Japonica Group]